MLRDPAPPPAAPVPAPSVARGKTPPPPPPAPPPVPDLLRLLSDDEARVRRRAALAVGRVGLREGVQPLVGLLADADPEVRQMAAFAIGLIGDASARDPLVAALADPSPLVKGSAAEALGLIGDQAAARAVAQMASDIVSSGALANVPGEAEIKRDSPAGAFRLALFALVRLKAYDALSSAALDAAGRPRARWWPVAYAFQRLGDRRGVPVLLALVDDAHAYTRAIAAKGIGAMGDRVAVPPLLRLLGDANRSVAIEAVRALGQLGDRAAAPALLKIVQGAKPDPQMKREAIAALGTVGGEGTNDTLLDFLGDPDPAARAAAIRALARSDRDAFVTVLSGLDRDPHWAVRSALAAVLGMLTPEAGLPRLRDMLGDADQRVIPAVLSAIAQLAPPDGAKIMMQRLAADDPVVRASAAAALATLKAPDGPTALIEAYRRGQADATYLARAAALSALATYGATVATPVLTEALGDKDWAVRVRAGTLLAGLDTARPPDLRDARPAPTTQPDDYYRAARLVAPPISTHAFIDLDRGSIEIELAVIDAPLTVDNFTTLARKGFFDGLPVHRVVPNFVVQTGDPRGDGEGGPGYAIRDELSEAAYVRGTVGMALDWADTGGSQFFITHSPQPHLDAKYTVFGRVISGMELVDQIEPGDIIRRVRIWDGE